MPPGPLFWPGPPCWMWLQLPMDIWEATPPGPPGEVRPGAGTKEQLLPWDEAEEGAAEPEEPTDEDEAAAAAAAADIPPPFPFPPPLPPPPPMVES